MITFSSAFISMWLSYFYSPNSSSRAFFCELISWSFSFRVLRTPFKDEISCYIEAIGTLNSFTMSLRNTLEESILICNAWFSFLS